MRRIGSRSILVALALVVGAATAVPAAPPAWPEDNPSADGKVRHTFVWIPAGDHRIPLCEPALVAAEGAVQREADSDDDDDPDHREDERLHGVVRRVHDA